MASEKDQVPEQTTPLEFKLADLKLQEKGQVVAKEVQESIDGGKEAINISAAEVLKELGECPEKASETLGEEREQPPEEVALDEVNAAKEEVQKSPDKGAFVPTVNHRSIEEPGSDVKNMDIPTTVEHKNADSVEKLQQQGKGFIQFVTGKILQSVKSVFSGITGGKLSKNEGATAEETSK